MTFDPSTLGSAHDRSGPTGEWPPIDWVAHELERVASTAMVDRMAMAGAAHVIADLLRTLGSKLVTTLPMHAESRECRDQLSWLAISFSLLASRAGVQRETLARGIASGARAAQQAVNRLGQALDREQQDATIMRPARIAALRALGRLAAFDIDLVPRIPSATRR